ncbi:MAG TPA: GntR family transcriptional regulator [Thermoleophilaceae bacterium]|nr:GntR family transcriptional regulator [Thermoleophilaceae bacterium]
MEDSLQGRVDRASHVPLGTQLVERIRTAVAGGRLDQGDRLPSVRELAESAGVNVNTVRAAYARLEAEGLVRSEHGRGTFVAGASGWGTARGALSRRDLREQIAALEATLARLPPPPLRPADDARRAGAALLSTDELVDVRDRLLERLEQLDTERTALLETLEELGFEGQVPQAEPAASRRATPSLAGARIRWVGA